MFTQYRGFTKIQPRSVQAESRYEKASGKCGETFRFPLAFSASTFRLNQPLDRNKLKSSYKP